MSLPAAISSVKVVEAVGKHTGTVIFLHVSKSLTGPRLASCRWYTSYYIETTGSGRSGDFVRPNGSHVGSTVPQPQVHLAFSQEHSHHHEFGIQDAWVSNRSQMTSIPSRMYTDLNILW
jgi:hypothetical protein